MKRKPNKTVIANWREFNTFPKPGRAEARKIKRMLRPDRARKIAERIVLSLQNYFGVPIQRELRINIIAKVLRRHGVK